MNRNLISKLTGRLVYCLSLALLSSTAANAHPGHGASQGVENGHTLVHYFTEPFHAAGMIGAVVIAAGCAYLAARVVRTAWFSQK